MTLIWLDPKISEHITEVIERMRLAADATGAPHVTEFNGYEITVKPNMPVIELLTLLNNYERDLSDKTAKRIDDLKKALAASEESLRDRFAMAALSAILPPEMALQPGIVEHNNTAMDYARTAYTLAGAMMLVKETTTPEIDDATQKRIAELEDIIYTVIPYIEDCDQDKAYKPGVIPKLVKKLKKAVGEE